MKTIALAVNKITNNRFNVSAFDAVYMRQFNKSGFKNYEFFYVDKNEYYQLVPKFLKNKNTAFFAFKSGQETEVTFNDSGESVTHFVAKKALKNLKQIFLIDVKTNKNYVFNVKSTENEKHFIFSGENYFADVFIELDDKQSSDMAKFKYKWNDRLAVEICVTHKVPCEKAEAFFRNNIPVFEVEIPESTRRKFNLDKNFDLTKENIDKAIDKMEKMFQKGIKGKFIVDPITQEYEVMCKYKDEIEKFRLARDKAEKEYNIVNEKLLALKLCVEAMENNKAYYDSLEEKNTLLESEIQKLKAELKMKANEKSKGIFSKLGKGS